MAGTQEEHGEDRGELPAAEHAKTRIEKPFDLEPGTYVFEVEPGPTAGHLTRADGSVVSIPKEGGKEIIRIPAAERVVVSYEANGSPPTGITLQRMN